MDGCPNFQNVSDTSAVGWGFRIFVWWWIGEDTLNNFCWFFLSEAACLPREVYAWPIHTSVQSFYKPFVYVNNNKHADDVELKFLRRNMIVLGICTSWCYAQKCAGKLYGY